MASLGIRCGGNHSLNRRFNLRDPPNLNARPRSLMMISNRTDSRDRRVSMVNSCASRVDLKPFGYREEIDNETVGYEKIDEWMRESVVEIVKNLREAPLLVQVYSKNNGSTTTTTELKTETAVADNWPIVTDKWKNGKTPLPEGVILVEELKDKKDLEEEEEEVEESITKAWGIMIQGKGVKCGPACYLLKTSRVRSSLGLFCTHFCLMKVKNFRETAQSQLTNCWLL